MDSGSKRSKTKRKGLCLGEIKNETVDSVGAYDIPDYWDIPEDAKACHDAYYLARVTVDTVLEDLKLEKYINIFQTEEIDMAALTLMTDYDLKDIGLPKCIRVKILNASRYIFVPTKQVKTDTVDTVLNSLGLQKYINIFRTEEVDMVALKLFKDVHLKMMGLPKGPRVKVLNALEKMLAEPVSKWRKLEGGFGL